MKFLFRWMFKWEILEKCAESACVAYDDGWRAGVNQQYYEPETAEHGLITYFEYWGEEE